MKTSDAILLGVIVLQCASAVTFVATFRKPEYELFSDVLLGFLYVTGIPVIGGLCLFVDRRRAERRKREVQKV